MTADVIVASACLPYLFHAVEIDGVPYWDGAYLGNPSIFPLFGTTTAEDVLLVQINPFVRHATPTSNQQIVSRLNEITFNSPLMGELRAIEFVGRLIDQGRLQRGIGPGKYRRINMHRIVLEVLPKNSIMRAGSKPIMIFSKCCVMTAAARRAASLTPISMTSAFAAPSIWLMRWKAEWA